jgi:(p)ppGpp synthase/HD superfamily hydrolase
MSTLERAIEIAASAHAGVPDKAGQPYILHPLRIMLRMSTNEQRMAAVLHDVVEDCKDWSLQRLRQEGFSEDVLSALDALTKRPEEADRDEREDGYMRFIDRAAAHPIARVVKEADLEDNADLGRIANPTDRDRARVEKYGRALLRLRQAGAAS